MAAERRTLVLVGGQFDSASLTPQAIQVDGSRPHQVAVLAEDRAQVPDGWEYLGTIDRLKAVLRSSPVTDVALLLGPSDRHRIEAAARVCMDAGVPSRIPLTTADDSPDLPPAPMSRLKRVMDITGSLLGLTILAPFLLATAAVIAVTDGFPVLFTQPRAGLDGRSFPIIKFRTMRKGADRMRSDIRGRNEISGGASFKVTSDPRVTSVGRFLRRTSIDELPQLWNVLRGEMSLVGPRPHPYDDVAGYQPWHLRRLRVKPGMTGLWQVELRGDPDFDNWVRKDLQYIDTWSLRTDLSLIIRTIPAIVRGTGR